MGFLDKVKNLFTEEIEVEEVPIKKEVMKVEIPAPTQAEPKPVLKNDVTESDLLKKEEKVRTPVFFDDKDFVNLEQPKPVERPKPKVEVPKKEPYGMKKEEPKKKFSPSPIISPVYGVLDKNYHKEDIASKGERRRNDRYSSRTSSRLSIDDVMKKAYGTLEDELETSMNKTNSILIEKEKPVEKNVFDDFDLLDNKPIELEKEEISEVPSIQRDIKIDPLSGLELDVNENDLLNDDFGEKKEDNIVAEAMDNFQEEDHNKDESLDLKESELFHLIDSMYEKRDSNDD